MSCNILVTASTDCPRGCIAFSLPVPETRISCTTTPGWADFPGGGGGQGGFAGTGSPVITSINVATSAIHGGQGGIMVTQTSTLIMTVRPTTSAITGPTISAASSSSPSTVTSQPTLSTPTPSVTNSSPTTTTLPTATATALSTTMARKPFSKTTGGLVTIVVVVLLILLLAILAAYFWRRKKKQKFHPRDQDQEAAMQRDTAPVVEVPLTIRQKRDKQAVREWERNATAGNPLNDDEDSGDPHAQSHNQRREERLKEEADAIIVPQEVKDSFNPNLNIRGGLPGELESRAQHKTQITQKWRREAQHKTQTAQKWGREAKVDGAARERKRKQKQKRTNAEPPSPAGRRLGAEEDSHEKLTSDIQDMMNSMQGIQNQDYDPLLPRGPPPRPDKHALRAMILRGEAERRALLAERQGSIPVNEEPLLPERHGLIPFNEEPLFPERHGSIPVNEEPVLPERHESITRRGPPLAAVVGPGKPPRTASPIATNEEIRSNQWDHGFGMPVRVRVGKGERVERVERNGPGRSPPVVISNEEIRKGFVRGEGEMF